MAQENADMAPTPAMRAAFAAACAELTGTTARWTAALAHDLPALNGLLTRAGKAEVQSAPVAATVSCRGR